MTRVFGNLFNLSGSLRNADVKSTLMQSFLQQFQIGPGELNHHNCKNGDNNKALSRNVVRILGMNLIKDFFLNLINIFIKTDVTPNYSLSFFIICIVLENVRIYILYE